jgi:hypothetical protein
MVQMHGAQYTTCTGALAFGQFIAVTDTCLFP